MKYAGLKANDIVDGIGVCVSVWVQGCPIHCKGCHNPETWDFNGGIEIQSDKLIDEIIELISKNGVKRNLSILGGEPLAYENLSFVYNLINRVRVAYPDITIYLWTGQTLEDLQQEFNPFINEILTSIDVLIDGPYVEELRDISLPLRGSSNQRVLYKNKDF